MHGYAIMVVASASHALRAEALLKAGGLPCKLIPVPRWLSSDCGICVRVPRQDVTRAVQILEREGVMVQRVHDMQDENSARRRT